MNRFLDIAFGLNGDVPMMAVARYCDILGCAFDVAALAKADPADLWREEAAPVDLEALRKADAACAPSFLEARESCREFGVERPLIRHRKVFECLLQRLRMHLAQERIFALEIDEILAYRFET